MNYRNILLQFAAALFLMLSSAPAQAVISSCDDGDPCTSGVCLEDGTCDYSPANNGSPCDTFNTCTTGVCSNGSCAETNAGNGTNCETFDACMQKNGHCSAGECTAPVLSNGAACRSDVLGPCLVGTCTTISTFSVCLSAPKCETPFDACDLHCDPVNGNCGSYPTHICDSACSTATCTPQGDFGHSCTNEQNVANNTTCVDGIHCNGKCSAGECQGSGSSGAVCGDGNVEGAEDCDDGDTVFNKGEACDGACNRVPCGKPTNSGTPPSASDALFALKAGVHSVECDKLVCDVNNSGGVTASDALLILKKAVGQPVTLNCPSE